MACCNSLTAAIVRSVRLEGQAKVADQVHSSHKALRGFDEDDEGTAANAAGSNRLRTSVLIVALKKQDVVSLGDLRDKLFRIRGQFGHNLFPIWITFGNSLFPN